MKDLSETLKQYFQEDQERHRQQDRLVRAVCELFHQRESLMTEIERIKKPDLHGDYAWQTKT